MTAKIDRRQIDHTGEQMEKTDWTGQTWQMDRTDMRGRPKLPTVRADWRDKEEGKQTGQTDRYGKQTFQSNMTQKYANRGERQTQSTFNVIGKKVSPLILAFE